MLTCIITLSIRFSWKKLGLKLFFTTKPNGHFHNLIVLGVKQIRYKIACVASEILFLLRPSQFSLLRIWCFKLKSSGFKIIRARNTKYTCYQRGNRFDQRHEGNETYQSCNESQTLILIDKTFARNLQY